MRSFFRVTKASLVKELRCWRRNPGQLFLIVLVPIMFWAGFNLLMGGVYSSGIDVALVVEEQNPGHYTNGLIEVLDEPDTIPPSMRLNEMDAETADALFDNGDVQLVITIPEGFEQALENNESTHIKIRVNNAHEDMTKNLRMPIIRKLDIFYQRYLQDEARVDFDYELLRPVTYPRLLYMAWTISIYGTMFSAIYIAGSSMTKEFEQETLDELTMSNSSPIAVHTGKMLTGVLLSFLPSIVLHPLGLLAFGYWPNGDIWIYLALTALLALFCSAAGIVLGSLLRNSVYLVPTASITGIFYWMIGGGINPLQIAGFGFGVVDTYSPISNAYRSLISMMLDGTYSTFIVDFTVLGLSALLMVVIAPILSEKLSKIDFGKLIDVLRQKRRRR